MKTILFDLDGTLLPMEQDEFANAYFMELAKYAATLGFEPKEFLNDVKKGTYAMITNNGLQTNEDAYWKLFSAKYGDMKKEFDEFYDTKFDNIKYTCGFNPEAGRAMEYLKGKGYELVLASNPIFPLVAQKKRMRWAGVNPDDFVYITAYENSCYCKPNAKYYDEILAKIGRSPDECVMVGNDVTEDMVAQNVGMRVFLMTACLLNKQGKDISEFRQGSFEQLLEYIDELFFAFQH